MIWGSTYETQNLKLIWNEWFAWHPVQLLDGRWVCGQTILRKYWKPEGTSNVLSRWEYKIKERP